MSDFIQFKTGHGDILVRPSAVIGVARQTIRTSAMRLVDGKVYNVVGSPKDVLDSYFATERDYYRDPNGCVTIAAVQKPIDAMIEYQLIDRPVTAGPVTT